MIYWRQVINIVEDCPARKESFISKVEEVIEFSHRICCRQEDVAETIKRLLQLLANGMVRYEDYRELLEFSPWMAGNGIHGNIRDILINGSGSLDVLDFLVILKALGRSRCKFWY